MNPVRLSEQQSVDCTYKSGNDKFDENYYCYGCQGCWFENSWKMMKDQGVMTNDDYPYTARVETCQHDFNKIWGYVTGYKQIPEGSDIADIKKVLKKQPIAIAVNAARPAWQYYKSGVVKKTDGCYKQLNHAVVLVGYTDSTDDMDDDDDSLIDKRADLRLEVGIYPLLAFCNYRLPVNRGKSHAVERKLFHRSFTLSCHIESSNVNNLKRTM